MIFKLISALKGDRYVSKSLLLRIEESLEERGLGVEIFPDRNNRGRYYLLFNSGYRLGTIYAQEYKQASVPEELRALSDQVKDIMDRVYLR